MSHAGGEDMWVYIEKLQVHMRNIRKYDNLPPKRITSDPSWVVIPPDCQPKQYMSSCSGELNLWMRQTKMLTQNTKVLLGYKHIKVGRSVLTYTKWEKIVVRINSQFEWVLEMKIDYRKCFICAACTRKNIFLAHPLNSNNNYFLNER